MYRWEVFSNSPAATSDLGRKIGERLERGSIIALIGELGCGKTLFTRGICRGLEVPLRLVNSPTFILVNEYRGRLPVFHLDLYRLGGEADVVEMGIMDYLARAESGAMIIEWAEKILTLLPADLLKVEFRVISARERILEFATTHQKYESLFKEIVRP
jgi:tRNA threonylcarbamoyladenosine biosynthesis protein TsaE